MNTLREFLSIVLQFAHGRVSADSSFSTAGAKVNIKDKAGLSPLCACAEIEEEKLFWSPVASKLTPPRSMAACGILDSDPLRPVLEQPHRYIHNISEWRSISNERHTVRTREIVRLLIDHGAEYTSSWVSLLFPFRFKLFLNICSIPEAP